MSLEIPSPAQVGVLGTAGVDVATDGIITSHMLEEYILWGMTFGAWVKIFLFVSVLVIILMNVPKAIMAWRTLLKEI